MLLLYQHYGDNFKSCIPPTLPLQALLGKTVEVTDDDDVLRSTFGIEITTMQLSGKDLFSVWDFAGQVESFITHQFFISTQSTVFTVLVDLTNGINEQRDQLMCWLGFIKMRNLGQVSDFCSYLHLVYSPICCPICCGKFIFRVPMGQENI